MVIFTTLHGDTGWLVAALFVWGFELDWSIFSWIQSYMCRNYLVHDGLFLNGQFHDGLCGGHII